MKTVLSFVGLFGIMSLISCGFDDVNTGPSFEEQLAQDISLIDEYLIDNEIDNEIHESGIRYVHEVIGEGASPQHGDVVVIKFNGTLLNGTFFNEDTIGLTLQLAYPTIEVMQLIVPVMNVGSRLIAYSPSGYCFGRSAIGSAPANSIMVFEIELLDIIKSEEDQLNADQNIIDEFLTESDLTAEVHESGIRFITIVEGTGNSPTISDLILVKYKGKFLDGVQFDQNTTGIQFSLGSLVSAWKIMLPTMREGGKIKIYCPSKFCYGVNGSATIPPNTILVFEIELISVN